MQTSVSMDSGSADLKLSGRFDFNAHREFRAAYEQVIADAAVRALNIDMGGVDYLDSSALGMLLMLRDKAGAANKALTLSNVRGAVKQVLDIANFGKLFRIL
ncbi:MAG: STAS domain-containing protein [Betaproteobacteria bacterium]|jgi:anti-anti-sigma factor|uniref:STAS domain-containing protein n=1 Tax=Candidatus Proximibacter danicus TaxID=2954365 RepID=A0A9D7K063_9PROT|nr:STAS domain-containing protein [Candidatus Proximibacter danicus]MBK9446467.1 STAS domain-containing protein [Betaproteobacteria bacterium]